MDDYRLVTDDLVSQRIECFPNLQVLSRGKLNVVYVYLFY